MHELSVLNYHVANRLYSCRRQ